MEVRLDVDPVKGLDGDTVGAGHYQTFGCGSSTYTSVMYSVSMGQPFDRLLTAAEAAAMMDQQLNVVKAYNQGKPIYIDQLLYMDITPGFERNAKLMEEERNAFLTSIPDILRNIPMDTRSGLTAITQTTAFLTASSPWSLRAGIPAG